MECKILLEFSGTITRIALGEVKVHASLGDISPSAGHESGVNIEFTKPQAWEIGLQTISISKHQSTRKVNVSNIINS